MAQVLRKFDPPHFLGGLYVVVIMEVITPAVARSREALGVEQVAGTQTGQCSFFATSALIWEIFLLTMPLQRSGALWI